MPFRMPFRVPRMTASHGTFSALTLSVERVVSSVAGLPKSVVRACHQHVALPAERYESYNVAMAGSIVMYDRLAKEKLAGKGGKRKSGQHRGAPFS